jgi:hypothetical protein
MRHLRDTRRERRVHALVLAIVAAACADKPVEPLVPATVVAISPTTQEAQVATAVAAVPTVKVSAASGQPVAGVSVTFAVISGGGSLTGATQTTDANGAATVGSWTLGTTAGPNVVAATVVALPAASFTATGKPGPAVSVVMAPDEALIEIGKSQELTAIFRDAFGNATTDPPVAWVSSNTAVARVSSVGVVTGEVNGSATITATSGGTMGTAKVDVYGVNSSLVNGDFEAGDPTFGWTIGGTRNYSVTRTPSPQGNAALLSVGSGPTTTQCSADPSAANFVYIDQRFRMTKDRVVEVDFRVPIPSDEDATETSTCPGWDRVEIDFGIGGPAKPPWGNATGVVLIDYAAARYQGHIQVNDFVHDKVASAAFDPTAFSSPVTLGPIRLTNGPTPGWLRASFEVSTSQFSWLTDDVSFDVTFRIEDSRYTGRNSSIAIEKVSSRPK